MTPNVSLWGDSNILCNELCMATLILSAIKTIPERLRQNFLLNYCLFTLTWLRFLVLSSLLLDYDEVIKECILWVWSLPLLCKFTGCLPVLNDNINERSRKKWVRYKWLNYTVYVLRGVTCSDLASRTTTPLCLACPKYLPTLDSLKQTIS